MWKRCARVRLGLAVVLVGAFACNSAADGASTAAGGSVEREASSLESKSAAGVATPDDPFGEDPTEQGLPTEQVQEIDWRAARSVATVDPAHVPSAVARKYEDAPVPVLLPDDPAALESLEPTVGRHWYAASFHLDGREVTIEGDRVARRVEGLERAAAAESTAGGLTVTQTEGVLTLSFTSFGAAYTVDVECEKVDSTGTCTDQSFAVELANRLVRLGGDR